MLSRKKHEQHETTSRHKNIENDRFIDW